jgi:predicted O-methyltransferase YrrM
MGSGFGYSTVWFAKAVKENGGGVVHHVVWDEELSQKAQKHLSKLGYEGMVKYTVAEAVKALTKYAGSFDLIFMDINKGGYPTSLPIIEEKLRPGGVLIVDNMLWSGRIFDQQDQDASTKGIRKLTELLVNNPKWIITLLPVRDGLIVAYKQ